MIYVAKYSGAFCKQAVDVLYETHLDSKNGRIEEPEKKRSQKERKN